jgi:hypothetical protein
MRAVKVATVIALIGFFSASVDAQVSVGAALGQSHQAEGKSESPYLGPGFGGSSLAGIGMVDVAIGSRVSIGGEASPAADISGTQNQRAAGGNNHFVSDHRDTVFSGLVKVGTPSSERVRAMAVVGGGMAQRRTERTGTFGRDFAPVPTTTAFQETLTDYVWAFTAGVDIAVGLTDHVALLGVGRFHQLRDNDLRPDGVVNRGVSSTIFRYGGGLQVRF